MSKPTDIPVQDSSKSDPPPPKSKTALEKQLDSLNVQHHIKIQELIPVALKRLGKEECISISELGDGAFHTVYKLTFSDNTTVAAKLVSEDVRDRKPTDVDAYNPECLLAEVATMNFVRNSGLYPDVPVPKVLAYDHTPSNPLGAPYMFIEIVEGRLINDIESQLDNMEERLVAIRSLARIHAALLRPVPFDRIGGLRPGEEEGTYTIGSMFFRDGADYGGPYNSLGDWWQHRFHELALVALTKWCRIDEDEIPKSHIYPRAAPQDFGQVCSMLAGIASHVSSSLSEDMNRLILIHADLAIRNVVFDENDLNKIVGVLDWTGAFIGPTILAARALDDLMTKHCNPVHQPGFRWRSVPHDWTSYVGELTEGSSTEDRVSWNVQATYLRRYYAGTVAAEAGMNIASLFEDARIAHILHELTWDATYLFRNETWVRETYWRLRRALRVKKEDGGKKAVNVSNILHTPRAYTKTMQRQDIDLGEDSERPLPRYISLRDVSD